VRAYAALGASGDSRHLALGATTAAAMQRHGVPCCGVAAEPTAAALISTLLESTDV